MGEMRSRLRMSCASVRALRYFEMVRLSLMAAAARLIFWVNRALFKALRLERTMGGRNTAIFSGEGVDVDVAPFASPPSLKDVGFMKMVLVGW